MIPIELERDHADRPLGITPRIVSHRIVSTQVGKLVLGLTDGNFAVWDLRSNETFMSRGKHFSGKLKDGITCGAWGPKGEVLAMGSANQLKVSRPMSSASWEQTAAKLHQPHKELKFRSISFSPGGSSLAVLAGTSVFAHLCIYDVKPEERKGHSVSHVHEMHPDGDSGAIQVRVVVRGCGQGLCKGR